MIRIKWPVALATLFVMLLGSYVWYNWQMYRRAQANSDLMSRIFSEVQEGLVDGSGETQALFNLQGMVVESGVRFVITGPGDTVLAHENLPFEVDEATPEGQERIRAYVRRLDEIHAPIGDPTVQLIHYGDSAEVRWLRIIPWIQAIGLLLIVTIGFLGVRYQRRAEGEKAWTAMARELAHQLGTPLSSLAGWLEVLRLPHLERPGSLRDHEIANSIAEDLERLERISFTY